MIVQAIPGPVSPFLDESHHAQADSIVVCNGLTLLPRQRPASNVEGLNIREFRTPIGLATKLSGLEWLPYSVPAAHYRIAHILALIPDIEMTNANAAGVIAVVQHKHP
jgi:hypothetical protein